MNQLNDSPENLIPDRDEKAAGDLVKADRNCIGELRTDTIIQEALNEAMPFESWERLRGETNQAWMAFCLFRDFGLERNIKRVMAANSVIAQRYNVWRCWSTKYQWSKRAGDYDLYLDRLKRAKRVQLLEERERVYQEITERILFVVQKRVDLLKPEELSQGNIMEWLKGSIDIEKEILSGKIDGKQEESSKQLEIRFVDDFEGT